MAKRLRKNREAGKIYVGDPIELNRWCVEMALRWPSHEDRIGSGGGYGGISQFPATVSRVDADVIGRANKLFAWVTTPH